tara:strand:- start:407 stop:844 length:438 start_codon:yes stop_codon:yes gene_type:complete
MAAVSFNQGLYKDLGDAVQSLPVKASATWAAGDFLKLTSGYLEACGAGDLPVGVAVATLTSDDTPSTSGDVSALVYVGGNNQYIYPADAGTVAITLVGKKMDVGGAGSVDIDASADDCILCVGVDIPNNSVIIQLDLAACFSGVA